MVAGNDLKMESIAPTEQELKGFDLNNPEIVELIHHAQQSDAADRLLTIREALSKYKRAVFWAMFLSTSLIMEGYDLVIVSGHFRITCLAIQVRENSANVLNTDYLVLRPDAISETVRSS